MDFLRFRANALSSLTLLKPKNKHIFMSKDEIEDWIKKEYERHRRIKNDKKCIS